jgi:hypothetical protein
MKNFKQLIEEYNNIIIPEDLEFIIKKTIKKREKQIKISSIIRTVMASAASIILIFAITVNISPAAAQAMSGIPAMRSLVSLVTFKELTYEDEKHELQLQIPQVEGLQNEELGKELNEKYIEQNTQRYNDFMKKIGNNELTEQNLALYTNYKVKMQTEDFLVVEGIVTEIAASGFETVQYDNIDLKNQLIITLPSLFKDESYIEVISDNIKAQMEQRMEEDEGEMFFVKSDEVIDGFDKIKPDQTFFINEDSKLVISFDEYEVAPGYMGIVEFIIPTKEIQKLLVSNAYVK